MTTRTKGKAKAGSAARPRDMIQVRALQALKALRAQAASRPPLSAKEIEAEIQAVRAERAAKVERAAKALRAAGEEADRRRLAGLSSAELDGTARAATRRAKRRRSR